MPWGPPFPLDDAATSVRTEDGQVTLHHGASTRQLGLAFLLVAAGPAVLAVHVLTRIGSTLGASLVAVLLALGGFLVARIRTQIVVTEDSLFRWGGWGRPRTETVETADPEVEVEHRPGDGTFVVRIRDRGEMFAVGASANRARAEALAERLAQVLGCAPP